MFIDLAGNLIFSAKKYDIDSLNFFSAAGITDINQQEAIDQLVVDFKINNLWNKMIAVYPFVGGTADTHKYNLINPVDSNAAYRLTYSGTNITHNSNGITIANPSNTVSSYCETFIVATAVTTFSSAHLSIYSRSTSDGNTFSSDIGANDGGAAGSYALIRMSTGEFYIGGVSPSTAYVVSGASNSGFFVASRTSSGATGLAGFKNGILQGRSTTTATTNNRLPNTTIHIGRLNTASPLGGSNKNYAFASVGSGLTDSDVSNMFIAVEKYQNKLNRQVISSFTTPTFTIIPTTFQSESIDFFLATGINDINQQISLDNLVFNLKTNNLWNKMVAIYPFIGGTANTHKYNLKDPRDLNVAYRLTYSGANITHSSNGITIANPTNTVSSYCETFIVPSAVTTFSSAHLSIYSRSTTNANFNPADIGSNSSTSYMAIRISTGEFWIGGISPATSYITSASTNSGFFVASRTSSGATGLAGFKNGILQGRSTTTATTSNILPSTTINIGRLNASSPTNGANKNYAFASVGSGLTDSEVSTLYNCIQTYQIQLNRQVN